MKPELIFSLSYLLVGVFIVLFINNAIIAVYYKVSPVENKKEIFASLFPFFQKGNRRIDLSKKSSGTEKSTAESFRKNMLLMTRLSIALLFVFILLFITTIIVIGMVKKAG
jgi:hypothetical protein